MNKKRIYITTSIPYVNAAPHIGHALEFMQADCLARFYKAQGNDVLLSSGSDENSLKNVQAAEREKIDVRKLVDKYSKDFESLGTALNLSWDIFNRTSKKEHFLGAQKFWKLCKKEDIYKKQYKGLYCVGCEQFYKEEELVDGKCPEHLVELEVVEEENYFFKLTNYSDYLYKLIESDKLKIVPPSRKNEILAFILLGLEDFSISRSKNRAWGWGVPVPGDDEQVMYVWFDALTTYLTALGFGSKWQNLSAKQNLYKEFWQESKTKIHVIGKGIIRFHAVYWIAMLTSAGIDLPDIEFVHGYVTVDGQKISKSLGNSVDPKELVDKFGQDSLRFYLLREIPAWGDGDFSQDRFRDLYNGELANGLGNLVARVARLATDIDLTLPKKEKFKFKKEVAANLVNFRFDLALLALNRDVSALDLLINKQKPWELEGAKLKAVILPIAREIREIAFNLSPFLPEASSKILDQYNGKISLEKPLFPRI